jgi:hypothetical protein
VTGPGAIDKPTVFLSHAATDQPIAKLLHDEIGRIFANGVEVFASSVPGVVTPGSDWLESIRGSLEQARAVIVLITPVSINRPWIWFEVGASWSRMREGEGRILPVCVPEVDKGSLPEPLSRLHAMSLGNATETRLVFQTLIDHFGFGSLKGYRHANIKARLPRYASLPVAESDIKSGVVYNGPYEGYSDDELREVLDDDCLRPAWRNFTDFTTLETIFRQEPLIHFRALDEKLALPPGASKRLLEDVATSRYPATIAQRTENTIRFKIEEEDYDVWRSEHGY